MGYQACSDWSRKVAIAQGICDHAEIVVQTQANLWTNPHDQQLLYSCLPSVAVMIPPEFPSLAIACAKSYRREKKKREAAEAAAMAAAEGEAEAEEAGNMNAGNTTAAGESIHSNNSQR